MTCDEFRRLAPEAALDILEPEVRAEVVDHARTCPTCRAHLAELATAADAVLLAPRPAEPPPGFETRVLSRLEPRPVRRPRRWLVPVAAAAALVVGVAAGVAIGGRSGSGHPAPPVAARLVAADGSSVGQVLVSDRPDRMVCVLDAAPAGAEYDVAVSAGGHLTDVGRFTTEGPGWAWTASLPVDGASVRRVVIRDPGGRWEATATLPS